MRTERERPHLSNFNCFEMDIGKRRRKEQKMEIINRKYYNGFEGEPEICFVHENGADREILIIWEGYFDQIMSSIEPAEHGWVGLAYHYNMCSGWYEEGAWVIDDMDLALEQLEAIDANLHGLNQHCAEILLLLCNMLKLAVANHQRIIITRE